MKKICKVQIAIWRNRSLVQTWPRVRLFLENEFCSCHFRTLTTFYFTRMENEYPIQKYFSFSIFLQVIIVIVEIRYLGTIQFSRPKNGLCRVSCTLPKASYFKTYGHKYVPIKLYKCCDQKNVL